MLFSLTRGILYVKVLSGPIPEINPKIELKILAVSLDQLLRMNFSNLKHFLHPKYLEQAPDLDKPIYCFLAINGDELVHLSRVEPFRKKELIIRGSYTLETYRGLNIATAVLAYIFQYLKKNSSVKRVFISTADDNVASKRRIEKAGFRKYKTCYHMSICNKIIKWAI